MLVMLHLAVLTSAAPGKKEIKGCVSTSLDLIWICTCSVSSSRAIMCPRAAVRGRQ